MSRYRIIERSEINAYGKAEFVYVIQYKYVLWWLDFNFGTCPNAFSSLTKAKENLEFLISHSTE